MRRVLLATTVILCAGLAGCDGSGKAPAVAAVVPADCPPVAAQPVTEPAPAAVVHRRHHRHVNSYARYEKRETYSSAAQYSGSSQSYYESGASQGYSGGSETETQSSGERIEAAVWIDGYGRKHYGGKALVSASPESPVRMEPWRGYDAKCDETAK